MYSNHFILKRTDQFAHDQMVKNLVNHLVSNNYINIKADIVNYPKPNQINGFIPDTTATKLYVDYIFEVETSDSIDIEHTKEQFVAFNKYAQASINRKFVVGVPRGYENKVKEVLRRLNINADVWSLN